MKNSWTTTFRRLASGAVIVGSTTMYSAMCYAHSASDSATDPVYNDGWQEGDNGGSGFGAWNFDGTYNTLDPGQQAMDDGLQTTAQTSSQYNNIGEAWTLFNPAGPVPGTTPGGFGNGPDNNPPIGTDIARVGRALPGDMHVGDTLTITVDNPTERKFFRGWAVKLLDGGANSCYAGDNCTTPAFDPGSIITKAAVGRFEYFSYGNWYDGSGAGPGLTDVDTSDGVTISVTRTGRQTGVVTMSSAGNPISSNPITFTGNANANGPHGVPDWLMIEFFNTDSDSYANLVAPRGETDFYISSMSMTGVPEPGTASLLVLGAGTLLGVARRRGRNKE